jgi:hypothetical protein
MQFLSGINTALKHWEWALSALWLVKGRHIFCVQKSFLYS